MEDDLILSAELSKFLEENNFEVKRVYDGNLFLSEVKQNNYELFLLDINVPKTNGLEVCEKIREEDKNTPIIMISAYGDLSDKKDAFNRLADDYLVKPFQFEELLMRMNSLIRRRSSDKNVSEKVITIQDLKINKTEQKVFRKGKEIILTVKEL